MRARLGAPSGRTRAVYLRASAADARQQALASGITQFLASMIVRHWNGLGLWVPFQKLKKKKNNPTTGGGADWLDNEGPLIKGGESSVLLLLWSWPLVLLIQLGPVCPGSH